MRLSIVVALVALAAPAAADPGDPVARCERGATYARRGDLPRAGLYLAGCSDQQLPDAIAADIARLERDVLKQLRDGDLASIEVSSTPDGLTAECTALPGESFTTPATLWVKPGTYEVRATIEGQAYKVVVETRAHARSPVWLGGRAPKPQPVKDRVVDIDQGAEPIQQGGPKAIKHGSLMSKKLRGEVEPAGTYPVLEDPLAVRAAGRPPGPRWLGLRVGAGMFDDGAARARAGVAVAATGRLALSGPVFLAGRFDWSRRGGDAMRGAVDALGLSAGAGATVLDRGSMVLAVIGQLRGDLRLAGAPVTRGGLGAAASVELALPETPITAGLRVEQGLTVLVPGARDRAVLVELGVDWR